MAVYTSKGKLLRMDLTKEEIKVDNLISGSEYFECYFRSNFHRDQGRRLIEFLYPLGAIFTPGEFLFGINDFEC